MMKSKS